MAKEDKLKALDAAIAQIEKQYGKGSVMKLGDNSANMNVETVPTGSLSLDIALGLGGLPKGRIVEVYGPESSGKTTVALHCVAEVQKRGGIAGFIDAEHALDPVYARNIGVDIDNLYISQPDCGEQALEITETMVRSGAVDIVVVDSVAALVPKAEIDGDMGDSHVGLQARLMSQALRKLTAVISKSNCIVIFINQLREKVGVMFGNPETTTGGRALKFYSSVRLDVRRTESLKQGGEIVGNDDNEVQGDTLLGEPPITFQTDSSGSWNIELDATKLTSDALPPVGSIDYVNDIFSSHRRMRHASVCVAPRTTRSTSVKCARCAWIPISNSSTKTSAMTVAAPITKWSV